MMQPEGDAAIPRLTLFLDDETLGASSGVRSEADPETDSVEQPTPEEPEEPEPRTPLNPWLIALWVSALVLMVSGVWGQIYLETNTYRTMGAGYVEALNAEGLAVLPAVVGSLAPWLVGIGLAAAVGATAIHSLRWYGTHSS